MERKALFLIKSSLIASHHHQHHHHNRVLIYRAMAEEEEEKKHDGGGGRGGQHGNGVANDNNNNQAGRAEQHGRRNNEDDDGPAEARAAAAAAAAIRRRHGGGGGGRWRRGDKLHQMRFSSIWFTSPMLIIYMSMVAHIITFKRFSPIDEYGWTRDPQEEALTRGHPCDILRLDASQITPSDFTRLYRSKRPVIMMNALKEEDWPAMKLWSKSYLITHFGEHAIKTGIGSDVVSSGGGQGLASMSLAKFLIGLNATSSSTSSTTTSSASSSSSMFTFDTQAFQGPLAQLSHHFKTPGHFLSFNHDKSIHDGDSWHMLSIGPSRQGLPFHAHGETWLALLFGYKHWFIYPPGKGLRNMNVSYSSSSSSSSSKHVYHHHHPLLDVWSWYTRIRPRLYEGDDDDDADAVQETPPLVCIQKPGEVMYLPAGWKHMTMNVGEAVGVGGQAAYDARRRLHDW